MTTAVAKTDKTSTALAICDLHQQQGSGMEEVGSNDLAVPYLSIIQTQSGFVNKEDEAFIPDAEVGEFINTVSLERFDGDEGIVVIPCYFRQVWIEKGPGKNGKFLAEHPAGTELALQTQRNKDGQDELPNGNILVRTVRHFCLLFHDLDPIIITMKSTQLKVSKRWNALLAGRKMEGPDGKFTPPTYSSLWRLQTVHQSNDDGSWYGFKLSPEGDVTDAEVFSMARDFYGMCNCGEVRAASDDS